MQPCKTNFKSFIAIQKVRSPRVSDKNSSVRSHATIGIVGILAGGGALNTKQYKNI